MSSPSLNTEHSTENTSSRQDVRSILSYATKTIAVFALWTCCWMVGAGKFDWQRGWVCSAIYIAAMLATGSLVQRLSPGLLAERDRWRSHPVQPFDKVCFSIWLPLTFVQILVAGMDVERFGWARMPSWTLYPGTIMFLGAMGLITWSMVVNPFAETSVRIQSERGHTVIRAGPYALVRHPMYVGSIAMYPATALMFGSFWALVPAAVITALIAWRTAREDAFLLRELPGYADYAARTRFRLIPGCW